MSEIPVRSAPRRLADWINPTGTKKVHSLIDKVYKRKNLEMAWERVHANRGSGGVDGQSLEEFERQADSQLNRLHTELREDCYQPRPVRQVQIPKAGKPGEFRTLGIPTIYDRVCQQALLNRLEPIFEPVFDEANFGYRRGRSTKDALRKVWKEIQEEGREWIVDADLKDFFGSVDHKKLLTLVTQRVADGRVLRLIQAMLKAGSYGKGRLFPSERGTPQGGVISPLLSNILLTPFDQEMRRRGYRLTRYADDWVVTCKSAEEARAAVAAALRILSELGVQLHPQKTRIVRVRQGFEFLGYKIKRGKQLQLPPGKIRSGAQPGALYAYPREKSIRRFMDQVRQLTKRRVPLTTQELIEELNPVLRGWGQYYKRAHVRRLFNRLDRWIVRRIWSHRFRRWRNGGWRRLPESTLYGEHGLVNLVRLIPSLVSQRSASS
jgi:RNA-directed DNA polymerase